MAFGGTTTHIDFAWVHPRNDVASAIERRINRWKNKSYVDYTFHVALTGQLPLKTASHRPTRVATTRRLNVWQSLTGALLDLKICRVPPALSNSSQSGCSPRAQCMRITANRLKGNRTDGRPHFEIRGIGS